MSKFNGYELSAATLLEFIHSPEIGQIGPRLVNKGDALSKSAKMTLDGDFVVIELKTSSGKTVTELVPVTFFKQLTPILK